MTVIFQGANILVDNKGCIKLADFGASKQVEKLVSVYISYMPLHCFILACIPLLSLVDVKFKFPYALTNLIFDFNFFSRF